MAHEAVTACTHNPMAAYTPTGFTALIEAPRGLAPLGSCGCWLPTGSLAFANVRMVELSSACSQQPVAEWPQMFLVLDLVKDVKEPLSRG